jgi:hypothetical protein
MTNAIIALQTRNVNTTRLGLRVTSRTRLKYDEWLTYGRSLYDSYQSLQWAIGDWLNYGEREYGEMYSQALEIFPEHCYQTFANYKYVASRVEISRRKENLAWSYHAEVAPLDPDEQVEWLDKAEANHWTKAELNQALVTAGFKRKFAPTPDEINDLPAPPLAGTIATLRDAVKELAERPDVPGAVAGSLKAACGIFDGILKTLEGVVENA